MKNPFLYPVIILLTVLLFVSCDDDDGGAGYLLLTNMDASTDEHTAVYYDLALRVDNTIAEFLQDN